MNKQKLNFYLTIATVVLVVASAAMSFTLSFDVLRQEAIKYGVNENLAELIPLLLDGAVVYFGLYIVWAGANDKRLSQWFGRGVVIAATCLSVVLNLSHSDGTALSVVYFIVAPVLLAVSLLTLETMLDHGIHQTIIADGLQTAYEALQNKYNESLSLVKELQATIESLRGENRLLVKDVESLQASTLLLHVMKPEMMALAKYRAGLITYDELYEQVSLDKRTITNRLNTLFVQEELHAAGD